ncbi:MAG: SRPBCC family protein [Bacteroidota bacterium]
MKIHQLKRIQILPISMEQAWDFFSNPKNLNEITPPDLNFQILSGADQRMYAGQLIRYHINPILNIPMQWVTEITHCEEHRYFIDEQRFGPYSLWHHQHHFKEVKGGIEMIDLLHYKLPMGLLGNLLAGWYVKGKVEYIFDYRYEVLEKIFAAKAQSAPVQA